MTINLIENEKQPITLNDTYEAWHKLKTRYRDAIVLLRNSDNYYAFEGDADIITGALQRSLHRYGKSGSFAFFLIMK